MHFTLPLLPLLATAALAFTIPEGQLDGTYSVHTAPDGTETHTFLQELNTSIEARSPVPGKFGLVSKRQIIGDNNDITCGGYQLDAAGTNAAYAALKNQCGNGASVGKGLSVYSKSNGVVAYYCNHSGGTDRCYASEMTSACDGITDQCGSFASGWDYFTSGVRAGQYGYESSNAKFC